MTGLCSEWVYIPTGLCSAFEGLCSDNFLAKTGSQSVFFSGRPALVFRFASFSYNGRITPYLLMTIQVSIEKFIAVLV